VARDGNFLDFVEQVVGRVFAARSEDLAALMAGELEAAREALVQKIGENISVRRARVVEAPVVGDYVHSNRRIGVLVGLSGGSRELARDIAMHVAAVNPQVVRPEQMPAEVIAKEREIYAAQARESGKPEAIVEKMIAGRINKFLAEASLVEQPFVRDPEVKVGRLLQQAGADILGFVRFEVGEGIEVQATDFAAEVAAQVQASR
jgi:elongation factor Ts